MGVSGSGKSTIAHEVARRLDWKMLDADDFHSDRAIAIMRSAKPITDSIRRPWISRMCQYIAAHPEQSMVLAYSGLKTDQRMKFNKLERNIIAFWLTCNEETLRSRGQSREAHFMPVSLLRSQLDSVEPASDQENIIVIDANQSIGDIVRGMLQHIGSLSS